MNSRELLTGKSNSISRTSVKAASSSTSPKSLVKLAIGCRLIPDYFDLFACKIAEIVL